VVAPLWQAPLDHVGALPGELVPVRPFEQSWPMERRMMLEALAKDAILLVARRETQVIGYGYGYGYGYVMIEDADPVWYTGDRYAELAPLSVARERANGIGSALMYATNKELQRRGIDDVQFGVNHGNDDAIRFYEHRGYRPDFQILYGSPGREPWACLRRDRADRKAGPASPPGPAAQTVASADNEGPA
jgi:ribosomal protein S18 acetylase RimI-like enzyme